MRGSLKGLFLKAALLAAFIAAFASPSSAEVVDRIVAVINDSVITLSELNAATAVALDKLDAGEKKDPAKMEELRAKVLDGLVEQKLVKQAADKAGIDISEREIDNAVEDIKKQNNLTQESLLLALAQSGLTVREY
ncbi:MAG TPA: SurA N-terminal domain-containing protein, partial [Thermodesulfobacteriota bacterium]|nr:SurA N-terminal domain-containing protein [Thermodesulfobacteriota bacterium]